MNHSFALHNCFTASLLQDLNQMMMIKWWWWSNDDDDQMMMMIKWWRWSNDDDDQMIKWWSNLFSDTNLTSNKPLNFCNDENFIDSRISLAISRFPSLEVLYNRKYKRARAEKTTFLKPVSTVHGKWYIIQFSLLKI